VFVFLFFLRPALVFWAVAMLLALVADTLFFGAGQLLGGFAIGAKPTGWFILIAAWWLLALAIGTFVLRKFHIFPF
jgi:hypothetical protein